jgi:purine-binding chemotaxis protein CheW
MTALFVVFTVGDTEYVLNADDVVELESFTGATHIPGAAPHVAGLVQIRGKVLAVIDLRARFGLAPVERTLGARVIVVRHQDRLVGLLADSARDVVRLDPADLKPPPDLVAQQSQGFVDSVAQAGKRLVMRVDFAKVIGNETLREIRT